MPAPFLLARTTDGLRVLEADLDGDDPSELVALARVHDAEVLWVHAEADLAPSGFERRSGYTQLRAEHTPPATTLPPLPGSDYARVLDVSYRGLWGHKEVTGDATPPRHATVVMLESAGAAIGLCRVFPTERLIDAPGLSASHRTVDNYVRLLLGGCAALGPGTASVESWGDAPEVIAAYCELGFEIAESVTGWELLLKAEPRSGRRPT